MAPLNSINELVWMIDCMASNHIDVVVNVASTSLMPGYLQHRVILFPLTLVDVIELYYGNIMKLLSSLLKKQIPMLSYIDPTYCYYKFIKAIMSVLSNGETVLGSRYYHLCLAN